MPVPPIQVTSYQARFRTSHGYGDIILTLSTGDHETLDSLDPAKFTAIIQVLRHSPVYYFPEWKGIGTGDETPHD